jgi:hypothetical protein
MTLSLRGCVEMPCLWSQCQQTFLNWKVESPKLKDRLPGTLWQRSAKKWHVISTPGARRFELISSFFRACRKVYYILYPPACVAALQVLRSNSDFCDFLSACFF